MKGEILMFTKADLRKLILPLIVEQILAVTIGVADAVMVASVGQTAISGVSLVDSVNLLLINILAALATGGAVVASQYLGRSEPWQACNAARQLIVSCGVLAAFLAGIVLVFRTSLLSVLFGAVEPDVMRNAQVYFLYSALSYPFIAVYNAGAALFRTMGNSRISMTTSICMNLINVAGNAILIYGCAMGVAGAAIATLVSRIVGSAAMVLLLRRPTGLIFVRDWKQFKLDFPMIRNIFRIGIPTGLENGMFQIGKVMVSSLVATFGTVSVAANSVANNISSFAIIPGSAIGLAMITVVGQCVGARDYVQARKYTKRLMLIAYIGVAIVNVALIALCHPIVGIYKLPAETSDLAAELIFWHSFFCISMWPAAFTLPNALRAGNDVRFTMSVSVFSMWVFRIIFSYILGSWLHMGVLGVWMAMFIDWVFRTILFVMRFHGHRWEQKQYL